MRAVTRIDTHGMAPRVPDYLLGLYIRGFDANKNF